MYSNYGCDIYGVFDRKGVCLYVGRTQFLERRTMQHRCRFGKTVDVRVLQRVGASNDPKKSGKAERKWIAHYRALGQAKHNRETRIPKDAVILKVSKDFRQALRVLSAFDGVDVFTLCETRLTRMVESQIRRFARREVKALNIVQFDDSKRTNDSLTASN